MLPLAARTPLRAARQVGEWGPGEETVALRQARLNEPPWESGGFLYCETYIYVCEIYISQSRGIVKL